MPRPTLPAKDVRREPVYVLLRRGEKRTVEKVAKAQGKSRSAVLRDAFLLLLEEGHYALPPVRRKRNRPR